MDASLHRVGVEWLFQLLASNAFGVTACLRVTSLGLLQCADGPVLSLFYLSTALIRWWPAYDVSLRACVLARCRGHGDDSSAQLARHCCLIDTTHWPGRLDHAFVSEQTQCLINHLGRPHCASIKSVKTPLVRLFVSANLARVRGEHGMVRWLSRLRSFSLAC